MRNQTKELQEAQDKIAADLTDDTLITDRAERLGQPWQEAIPTTSRLRRQLKKAVRAATTQEELQRAREAAYSWLFEGQA